MTAARVFDGLRRVATAARVGEAGVFFLSISFVWKTEVTTMAKIIIS
jgi:hypothetical protein